MSERSSRPPPRPDLLIGVYPPLEPAALMARRRAPAWPVGDPGLHLTHLGRGGVWSALGALGLGPGSRVAMPAYHCGSEVEAVRLAGAEVDFYRLDARLAVDEDDLARAAAGADAVYLISHFGFPLPPPPRGARLVIADVAHGLFSSGADGPLGRGADAAIFCPRKSLGVPDGGAVVMSPAAVPPPTPACPGTAGAARGRPPARHTLRSSASLVVGRAALSRRRAVRRAATAALARLSRGDAAARRGHLTDVVIGEWDLSVADMERAASAPARLTASVLVRADAAAIRARRRHNYGVLASQLSDHCPERYRELPPGVCPLYLPVLAPDRPAAVVGLLARGVRAIEVWPVPHPLLDRERFADLEPLRRGLLGLPVHQGLDDWHVAAVAAAAQAVLR